MNKVLQHKPNGEKSNYNLDDLPILPYPRTFSHNDRKYDLDHTRQAEQGDISSALTIVALEEAIR
jgi:hypothetical protein